MNAFVARIVARWAGGAFALSVVYAAVCMLIMITGVGGRSVAEYLGAWGSFPVSVVICVVLWPSLVDPALSRRRRLAWGLIFAALVLDIVASVGWGYSTYRKRDLRFMPDALYIFFYPLAALAFVLHLDLGGRVKLRARSSTSPPLRSIRIAAVVHRTCTRRVAVGRRTTEHWSVVGYGVGDAIAMIAAAMLAMQITDWRAERPILWLLIAMVVTLVADLLWINSELRGTYVIGGPSDIAYFVFYICMFAAARYQLGQRQAGSSTSGLQGDLRGSLPSVALMVGTIALLDDRLNLATGQSPLLVWVLVAATLLVVAGQAFATREVVGLHREVATRRFDERLTELVRRSSDMIAICDEDGVIVMPAPRPSSC
jgi:hypothetical protein